MLPQELQDVINNPMIPSLVEMGPKIVYDIGVVSACHQRLAGLRLRPGPDSTPPPVRWRLGRRRRAAPTGARGGDADPAAVAPPALVAAADASPYRDRARLPEFFGGLPAWLLLGGLALRRSARSGCGGWRM